MSELDDLHGKVGASGRRGLMFVVSSPSGAGKTTLAKSLITRNPALNLSISVTTRERRPSEADGVHYHFIDQRTFDRMRDEGDLLEHAEVHGNCYGTPKSQVQSALEAGKDILFDIDWQGAQQLRACLPDDLVSIFILPPSATELENRLRRRAEDGDETIVNRLKNAAVEIPHWSEYDYVVVNRDVEASLETLECILAAERMRRDRQVGLAELTDTLVNDLTK